jgi:hypothetical protein
MNTTIRKITAGIWIVVFILLGITLPAIAGPDRKGPELRS